MGKVNRMPATNIITNFQLQSPKTQGLEITLQNVGVFNSPLKGVERYFTVCVTVHFN